MDTVDSQDLHAKWRPKALKDVVGQDHILGSLKKVLAKPPHAFLFSGPSGTGKTSLARIVAKSVGVTGAGLIDIDAATNSGIENMRGVLDRVIYRSFSESGRKFVLVDECHALSKATWQSLLKALEEPPPHVYWGLCTTELDKVPVTIQSRCVSFNLKPVSWDVIAERLEQVAEEEGLDVSEEVIGVCARSAQGNLRQALVYLGMCDGVQSKKEAAQLLATGVGNEKSAIDLARMLCTRKGATWKAALDLLKGMDKDSPEGIRLVVVNYAASSLMGGAQPEPLLAVLDAFRGPYNPSEKFAPLFLSVGTLLLD